MKCNGLAILRQPRQSVHHIKTHAGKKSMLPNGKKKKHTTSDIQPTESCWVAFLKFFLERVLKIIMPKSKFKLKYQYMFSQ